LSDAPLELPDNPAKLTLDGLHIPDLAVPANSTICGCFTLPELPDASGETISNTPILSGTLEVIP
jgi:hypothetical protein